MSNLRRVHPNQHQYDRFKKETLKTSSKSIKPLIESGYMSEETTTHPIESWILKNTVIFRGLWDISSPKLEWSARHFSDRIRNGSPQNTLFFIDTSFFSTPVDFLMWDAILSRKIVVTPSIAGELDAWLRSPHHNRELSTLLGSQVAKGLPQIEFLDLGAYVDHAFIYYVTLLSLRKDLWKKILPSFSAEHGGEPSDNEMRTLLQKEAGDFINIAYKGWLDRHKPNRYADEELVVSAVFTSIMRGVETVILTRDHDIITQFINFTLFIKAHYASMSAANYFSIRPEEFPIKLPPTTIPEFEKQPIHGITKVSGFHIPSENSFLFLPPSPISVMMHCLHFDRSPLSQKFSVASFHGETGMRELLATKAKFKGKNTDKFLPYNCTVTEGLKLNGEQSTTLLVHDDKYVNYRSQDITEYEWYFATKKKQGSSRVFYQYRSK